jgi:hypothetical protein
MYVHTFIIDFIDDLTLRKFENKKFNKIDFFIVNFRSQSGLSLNDNSIKNYCENLK